MLAGRFVGVSAARTVCSVVRAPPASFPECPLGVCGSRRVPRALRALPCPALPIAGVYKELPKRTWAAVAGSDIP